MLFIVNFSLGSFVTFLCWSCCHVTCEEQIQQTTEESNEGEVRLSLYLHGGSVAIKKKKYLSDFYHLDVQNGLWRKFFLFDSAKGRDQHSMAKVDN